MCAFQHIVARTMSNMVIQRAVSCIGHSAKHWYMCTSIEQHSRHEKTRYMKSSVTIQQMHSELAQDNVHIHNMLMAAFTVVGMELSAVVQEDNPT